MSVSTNQGGTEEWLERGAVAAHLKPILDYVRIPKVFVCPLYKERTVATNRDKALSSANRCYSIAPDAEFSRANQPVLLAGDRHSNVGSAPVGTGLHRLSSNQEVQWRKDARPGRGNALFGRPRFGSLLSADEHAEFVLQTNLMTVLGRRGCQDNRAVRRGGRGFDELGTKLVLEREKAGSWWWCGWWRVLPAGSRWKRQGRSVGVPSGARLGRRGAGRWLMAESRGLRVGEGVTKRDRSEPSRPE